MKKIYSLFLTLILASFSYGQVINEVDPDQSGSDTQEFVEISWTANTSLDGLVLVTFNGNGDASYGAFDLDGFSTDANGFFVVGNTAVNGVDLVQPSNFLQNGADAVALYTGSDTDFPNGTAATTSNLLSALVYGTNDSDDTDLLSALGETTQYNDTATESMQRQGDGSYLAAAPTPDAANSAETCDLILSNINSTCDAITAGTDTYTATVDFTGGGTGTYTVTATSGTVDLTQGDPSVDATGTITVTGINEGTDITINAADGGACDLDANVFSPSCVPSNDLPITDDFDYSDGSLIGNGLWTAHSGTPGDFQVLSGQGVVQHGAPSEDINIEFTAVTGSVYYSFDFSVDNPGNVIGTNGTDFEYFAHLMNDGGSFRARLDIVAPNTTGDYTLGISSGTSTAEATCATDLTFGTTYRVTVRFGQDNSEAQLWIDATSETDTSISGSTGGAQTVNQFAFRQSDSSENETIRVDNLTLSQSFNETLSLNQFDATSFSIFPNPTNTGIVTITSSVNEEINVQVFDLLGKQVKNETLTNNTLNVSNLKTGIYLVKITQNNASVTKKLVIN